MTNLKFLIYSCSVGVQPSFPRMHFPPLSSTVGLACGSSPFNDALPPMTSSSIHPGWMPHNPHYPRFRGVQPFFLPVERSDLHFHRPCHPPPSPCHMSVCNVCTRISCYRNSPFPKRPRFEGGRLLPTLENATTMPVLNATLQASQAHKKSLRTLRPPPPLLKTVQNRSHHRTSAVPCSGTETPQISHARNISGNDSKHALSTHTGCLKDGFKYNDEVSVQFHSNTIRKSSTALCKVYPQYSCGTGLKPTKRGCSSEVDKNNNTNSDKHNEIAQSTTSSHENIHKDTSTSSNLVKKEQTEKRSRFTQSNASDTETESYSMKSQELPEHVSSFRACDHALDCMATREHVQQERQERCFVIPQEKRFLSSDENQSGKSQSCDAKVKHHTLVCKCCSESRSLLYIPERQQNMPQEHHALGVAPRVYKKYANTASDNSLENNRTTGEQYEKYPVLPPTGYHKCSTDLCKLSYKNQQFTPSPRDKIARCHPTTKEEHQGCVDSPFKFQAPHFSLNESNVPQLRSGGPRTRCLKDKSLDYGGVPKCCPTSCQSLPCKSVSPYNRSMQTNDDFVFSGPSRRNTNNNSTRATDQIPYKPSVTNDNPTTNMRNSESEQQITRQPVVLDQPRKTTTPATQYDRNTDTSITSPVQRYQQFSNEKTHNITNVDRNQDQMGPRTQYQEACRNRCHDSVSVSRDETTNGSNLLQGPKRKSLCSDSNFVTSLNDLLKRRTDATERQQRANFSFDETQRKEATLFQNKNAHTQSSPCQEERRKATIFQSMGNVKSVEDNQKASKSECDENRRMGTTRFPNEITNMENKALNDQATDTSKTQQTCHSPCPMLLPPDEDELDDMDGSCGGYAIDHSSLPKIVAVHSIVKRDDTRGADQSRLSASDKIYWNDLLKKLNSEMSNFKEGIETQESKPEMTPEVSTTNDLRSLLKGSKVIDNQKQREPFPGDRNVTFSPKKDSITQPESLNEGKTNESISQWTMWEYLSPSSRNVAIHVTNPSAYAETERKTQLPRKKPTVPELSKKILITRERIKKETIPWKKKLLYSLEAILTKRLRKTEKETGVKASISFEEGKVKEELKEKKNGQKERRNSQEGKEKIAVPRQKQTIKKTF